MAAIEHCMVFVSIRKIDNHKWYAWFVWCFSSFVFWLYESACRVYWVPQADGFGWSETYQSQLHVHARDEMLPLPLFSATQKKVIRPVSLIQTLPCFFGLQIVGGRFTQLLASSVTLFVWKSCSSHFRFCEFWGKSSFYYPPRKLTSQCQITIFLVGYYTVHLQMFVFPLSC